MKLAPLKCRICEYKFIISLNYGQQHYISNKKVKNIIYETVTIKLWLKLFEKLQEKEYSSIKVTGKCS